jgi:hypothetical protein
MPRAALHALSVQDQSMHRAAAAIECATMAYVVSEDTLGTGQPILMRAAIAGVVWFLYERSLQTLN